MIPLTGNREVASITSKKTAVQPYYLIHILNSKLYIFSSNGFLKGQNWQLAQSSFGNN